MILLKDINHSNWLECIELELTEEQRRYINPNIFSLAEAFVHSGEKADAEEYYRCIPFAVYSDAEMVGFAMLTYEKEYDYDNNPAYEIYRIMIDRRHQGNGYGREALRLLLEYAEAFPCGKAVSIYAQWHPENVASGQLFAAFGFETVGKGEDGAVIARLQLDR